MARDTEPSRNKARDEDQPADAGQPESEATKAADQNKAETQDDGFAQLREHHKALRALLGECANITDAETAENVLPRLAGAWRKHAEAHGLVYDASVQAGLQEFPLLGEIAIDTALVSFLLGRAGRGLDEPLELAALRVAARLIGDIIEREENPRSGLFAKAKAAGVEPAALDRRIRACMTALSGRDGEARPQLRHLMANQEEIMPRNSNMPERDERGRFVSDDDYGSRRSGRYDDDRDRDSRGRFTSDRDDDRYGSRGRYSRRDDDDDRRYAAMRRDDRRSYSSRDRDDDYARDHGQGGWFGDPRGHAEAARRGWDHRRDDDDDRYGSRGRYSHRDDDDDRRYASSRRDYDDRRSYSSRDRDDDYARDRGQGGWFGDREGHAEAARRGWDHRRDDDDDRYGSRGRR